jgi:hypothetical protein
MNGLTVGGVSAGRRTLCAEQRLAAEDTEGEGDGSAANPLFHEDGADIVALARGR